MNCIHLVPLNPPQKTNKPYLKLWKWCLLISDLKWVFYDINISITVFIKKKKLSYFCLYDWWSTETIDREGKLLACQIEKNKCTLRYTRCPPIPLSPLWDPSIRFRQFPLRNLLGTLSVFPLKGNTSES